MCLTEEDRCVQGHKKEQVHGFKWCNVQTGYFYLQQEATGTRNLTFPGEYRRNSNRGVSVILTVS